MPAPRQSWSPPPNASPPACTIMGLMMLGAGPGSQITIEADGWDAKEALEAVAGLVEAGFNED
jgi:phosphocarrier protein HPr